MLSVHNLQKAQWSYLVCILLESSTFRWQQHWVPCNLNLTLWYLKTRISGTKGFTNTFLGHFQVVFEGVRGRSVSGDIAIDDIQIHDGTCPPPGTCNFEMGFCLWQNDKTGDNFDFMRLKGSTSSNATGPDSDHTLGTAAGTSGFYSLIRFMFAHWFLCCMEQVVQSSLYYVCPSFCFVHVSTNQNLACKLMIHTRYKFHIWFAYIFDQALSNDMNISHPVAYPLNLVLSFLPKRYNAFFLSWYWGKQKVSVSEMFSEKNI